MNIGAEEVRTKDKVLLDLAQEVSAATDFQGALAALTDRLCDLIPCDGASVMWLSGDHLEVVASRGSTAPLRGLTLPVSQVGAARAVLAARYPVIVADAAEDARWQQIPGEENVRAWLGAPMILGNRPLGILEWTAMEPTRFDDGDLVLAAESARLIAPMVHRAQLLEDARQRLREWLVSHTASAPQVADLSAELQQVVNEALEFAEAQHSFIFLQDEADRRLRCVVASGPKRKRLAKITLRGDGTLGGWRVPLARPSDLQDGGQSDREAMSKLGIERTLILPLRVRGEQAGMLGVAEPRQGSAFGRDAIRLLAHLASQASVTAERVYRQNLGSNGTNYEAVFHSSPLGVGILTINGELRLCNPALSSLLSCPHGRVVGRRLSEFLVPGDGERMERALEEAAIGGRHLQVDVRVQSGSREPRHLRVSLCLAPVTDDQGGSFVAIMEDVTSLKILERERVDHLSQLRDRHKQLKELDQLKSRFVSNVSHELRTPLAVIKLYATLARKGHPDKKIHYLRTIEQETHRLETMVENVLDLSRIDREALTISPELLQAEGIIAQVLQVYQETAQRRSIELRNHARGALPLLWADKNHFIQMLTNLVDNALRYTPSGGRVWVAARETTSGAQQMLEISVGDTGGGIPEDEQEKVFDRFYRGRNNPPGSTGTGLGLAIVRELMRQHGGEVVLTSREGEGSVFALQFPLHVGESSLGIPDEGEPE